MKIAIDRRIPCRVCERNERAHPDYDLLCVHCGSDLPAARALITTLLDASRRACDLAWSDLSRAIPDVDDPLSARWCAFQEAYQRQDATADRAMRAARDGMAGPLADLIRLWCNHLDAQRAYNARRIWADRADLTLILYEPDTSAQGELAL